MNHKNLEIETKKVLDTNRKYKDSVFTLLFGTPEKMLELYNAINGTADTDVNKIQIRTLSEVLYHVQKNDLAFTYEDKMVILVEHQSTINQNMPLRMLMYLSRTYEKIVDDKAIYNKKLVKIPTPEIIVLYNGEEKYPLQETLKLSDAYREIKEEVFLELKVKVYNINYKAHSELLRHSQTLREYSYFIEKIREYTKLGCNRDKAIYEAIKKCINEHVLEGFLKENGSEVINMLFAEYSVEREIEVVRAEALEEGRERGREEGIEEGIEKGIEEGIKDSIIDLLSDLGVVGEEVKERLQNEKNLLTLKRWNKKAARCESIEQFLREITSE